MQTEPLDNNGKTVFVTPSEKQRVDLLKMVFRVGTPSILLGAVVLHFLVGVKLFSETPTLREYLDRKRSTPPRLP
jgi:hypothetical protein